MKRHMRLWVIGCLLAAAGTISSPSQTVTNDYYQLTLTANGAKQEGNQVPSIGTLKFTTINLINLALGNTMDKVVPANQVLALVVPRDSAPVSIVVFDTAGTNVLATVATNDFAQAAVDDKGGLAVMNWLVEAVGGDVNALEGGTLTMSLSFSQTAGSPINKLKGALIGVLDVRVKKGQSFTQFPILLTKGKLKTGPLLATTVVGNP